MQCELWKLFGLWGSTLGAGVTFATQQMFFFASNIFQNNEDNLKYFPDHLDKYQFIQMVKYDNVYIMMQSLE